MAKGRDRPKKEPKRKKQPKASGGSAGMTGTVAPSYQPPTRPVEVIKPRRKEREPEPQEPNSLDEG